MSASDDVDNVGVTSAGGGGNDDDVVGEHIEVANNQESSSRDSNNSNEDGVMVNTDNNGSGGDSDGVVVSEDAGREDMFMDAPEDLGPDGRDSSATFTEAQGSTDGEEDSSRVQQARFHGLDNEMQNDYMVDEMERLRAMLDKTLNEKESIMKEHKDEMEMAAKGIANLRDQMKEFTNKQLMLNESQPGPHSRLHDEIDQVQLHEMIHECSMFLRSAVDEVQDLNAKSTEAAVSREIVSSYMNSVQNESAEIQFQKDQYMDEVTNRMLNSFASLVYVGDLADYSTTGKIAHIEKSLYVLIENYNWFLYQSDQLKQCLTDGRPDLAGQTDYGVIFAAANDEILGFKKKETDFVEKLNLLEKENRELKELFEKHQAIAETANAELERLKAELDQEKHRYSNTKEKLSLAVTKGKALVQQRDTLKQALANKTNEIENCLVELKEKSSALEAAELIKEELVKSQIVGATLHEVIAQKDLLFEKLEDILLESGVPEELRMKDVTEKTRWLVDERDALKDVSLKFHQLADALLSIDLPENFSFSDLESRLGWLTKSYDQAKSDLITLQNEVVKTGEALSLARAEIGGLRDRNVMISETAQNETEQLTASLSMVLVEKDCIEMALEDIGDKFEAIVLRERQTLTEKEHMLKILLEASGVTVADSQSSEAVSLVEKCIATLKERWGSSHESSDIKEEILQNLQSLLYVKDQELVLRDNLLEEETRKMKTEMEKLSIDLKRALEESTILKEQNDNIKKDLERTEDKSAMIREKLSMAVKKGKGLVQEREGLKNLISEQSSEIEKLKLELQQRESTISHHENESSRLLAQVEGIAKLEENIFMMKDERDQLERDLVESNKFIDALTESINSISRLETSSSEQPLEKLKWLGEYLSEIEAAKAQAEQRLENAMLELDALTSKVSEAQLSIGSLETSLAVSEEKLSQLAEEKRELEVARTSVEQELHRAMSEASSLTEADVAKKALENALALAENDMSRLAKEKEEAELSNAATVAELDKVKTEIAGLVADLSEATTKVKALEDTISHMETKLNNLYDEKNEAETVRTKLEDDLKKFKEEADSWDDKLQDAQSSIKTLQDALTKAENDTSHLSTEKKGAEQELSVLNTKLNACLEERDVYSNKVHELETDLASIQNQCSEMRLKLENYQDIEATLSDKNAEISTLESSLMTKEKEAADAYRWASQVKNLIERADEIHVDMEATQAQDSDPKDSIQIYKLLYIVDKFAELQDQTESLAQENTNLQTALSDQNREIKHLKDQVQGSSSHEQELEGVKSKIVDAEAVLNKIIQKFSSTDVADGQKYFDLDELLQKVEKLLMGVILESENLKSKADELEREVEKSVFTQQQSAKLKEQVQYLEAGVQKIIKILRSDIILDQKITDSSDLIQILEESVTSAVIEHESLRSKSRELDSDTWKIGNEKELVEVKDELFMIEGGLKRIIQKLRGDAVIDQRALAARDLLQHLEKMIVALITETEDSKSEIGELESKLLGSQKIIDELSLKVKSLEDSLRSRIVSSDTVQERSIFEASSLPPSSEISEIEDVSSVSKATISPVPSSTHVRTMWKGGSSDHIVNIDPESSRLIDNEAVEDKGHVFKSLNTSGLVPNQGKIIADRIDGLWVSGGRSLMSRPRARLGVIAYWLFLHMWLLGTIL